MIAALPFVACNKDDDDDDDLCGSNWNAAVALEDEINGLNSAAATYANDPTTENCEKYRQAILDYLDAVRGYEDCYIAIGQRDEFNKAVSDSEEQARNITC